MYLELYPAGTSDFDTPGTPLTDAIRVMVKNKINTAPFLAFDLLRTSPQWGLIQRGAVIKCEGQLYIVKIICDGRAGGKPYGRVQAKHLFWEVAEKVHIPSLQRIGANVQTILDAAFAQVNYAGLFFSRIPDNEVAALGMKAVSRQTDIESDKTNPIDVISQLIGRVGGEFYADNFRFAFVEQLGADKGLSFTYGKNIKNIERIVEDTKLVTRLFPYGQSNLEITNVNGGRSYIDSPYINNYPYVHAGQIDYTYDNPQALLTHARWEFSPENYHRIDIPQLSYKISAVDLFKLTGEARYALGDVVQVKDASLNINAAVRVVEYDYYPYEHSSSIVVLGNPPKNIFEILTDMSGINAYFYPARLRQGEITLIKEEIDNSVSEVIHNSDFVNEIQEVTRIEVLSVSNIHATSAYIDDLFVERMETNVIDFLVKPALADDGKGGFTWEAQTDEDGDIIKDPNGEPVREPNYIMPDVNRRYFIRIQGIDQEFIEWRLSGEVMPFIVGKSQAWWTSIADHEEAYRYITYEPPETREPKISPENREMFRVMITAPEVGGEFTKGHFRFKEVTLPPYEPGSEPVLTLEPEITLGVGDGVAGDDGYVNGQGRITKSAVGLEMLYRIRTAAGQAAAGTDIGLRATDTGVEYFDVENAEWRLVGSGGGRGGSKVIAVPQFPHIMDLITLVRDDIIIQYDPLIVINPIE